ncbi:hypothetical protein [Microbispora sp. NPDC049633]|uniref:hypothetical protein n=1 Tax=Microbispora sp. NPDC049633 TaxID=3154355 RepID=UPI003449854E
MGEQWVALEDRLEWGGGKCRDGAHLVAIDPATNEMTSVGPKLPKNPPYALQEDFYGRVYAWGAGRFIVNGSEFRGVPGPRYQCGEAEDSCLEEGGIWPAAAL